MSKQYSLNDVVRITGVPYYRLYYALYTGQIPEPQKIGRTRIYTEQDVQKLKEHFAVKEAAK
jgi:DNA-binding transcriptional MerR regulator